MNPVQNTGFRLPECTRWHVRQSERRNFLRDSSPVRGSSLDTPFLFSQMGAQIDN